MGSTPGIGKREREILTAIVETYISTGEPVGSRTLARTNRESLSPASIRNVMSDLADAGFLEQPHTSAGRVPTPQAYRFYVKQLTGEATAVSRRREPDPGQPAGPERRAGIHGAHLARAVADFARRGRDGHFRSRTAQCAGACVLPAPGRQESAGGGGHAQRPGARPRAAPDRRPDGRRSGSCGQLHQPELSRLGDGSGAQRDCPAGAAGAHRIRPADEFGRAALRPGSAGDRSGVRRPCSWKARRTW